MLCLIKHAQICIHGQNIILDIFFSLIWKIYIDSEIAHNSKLISARVDNVCSPLMHCIPCGWLIPSCTLFFQRVLPDRKTFAKDLDKAYEAMEKKLKKKIDAQDYVSATADTWSANNKSFTGVTIHWIDAGTLIREKAAIACKRFRGRHTYNAVATELEDIFSRYGLNNIVTACVTE